MNKHSQFNLIAPIVILCISAIVVSLLTPFGSATTPDSLSYLDIAENISNGHGIVATDFSFENYNRTEFKSQKLWPPLYPILISITSIGKPNPDSVSYLSIALIFVTGLFLYLIQKPYINWQLSLLSSILVMITIPVITVYTYVWSETLFIPLSVIALWSSVRYLDALQTNRQSQYAYISVLLLSLIGLAYTRYIGIIFFVFIPLIYFYVPDRKAKLPTFSVNSIIYAIVVGSMLINNYLETGSISGAHRAVSENNIFENIFDAFLAIKTMLVFSPLSIVITALITTATIIALTRVKRTDFNKTALNDKRFKLITLQIAICYIVAIIGLRSINEFDELDIRLISPVFPYIWILLFIFACKLKLSNLKTKWIKYFSIFLINFFVASGIIQFNTAMQNWRSKGTPDYSLRGNFKYNNFTLDDQKNTTKSLLQQITDKEGVIIVDTPILFEFLSGITCVQKPEIIEIDEIRQINNLPKGSVLLVEKGSNDTFFKKSSEQYTLSYRYFDLGNKFAFKTPIEVKDKSAN